jgi:Skp family chaperone for outer membrane proteins
MTIGMRAAFCVTALLCAAMPSLAQETVAPALLPQAAVLVLDQDRLFGESRFGKAVLARHQQAIEALQAENRRIETALEAEERDLTERRSKLPSAEFKTLAVEFDTKAEGIRKAQTAKSDDIKSRLEAEQRRFVQTVRPVLDGLMRDVGALVIIDARAVIYSQSGVDVTAIAISRLDDVLGEGLPPIDSTGADPLPEPPAEPPKTPPGGTP